MKAKKPVVLTLLAIMLLSTLACGGGAQGFHVTLPPVTGYLTYTDEANDFSISYPENWNAVQRLETSEKTVVAFVDPRFCCAAPAGVNLVKEELPYAMSVREYFERGIALLMSTYQWYSSISQEEVTLGGRAAIKHVYAGGFERLAVKQMEVYLVEGSRGWVMTCTSTLGLEDQYEPTFHTMVNSFRLLD